MTPSNNSIKQAKPERAVPVGNGCALPDSPIPIEPTIDGAFYLAAEVIWPEIWPAAHNREIWGAGPDGTYDWRDQADGFYERGEKR
jgi:hypothetical protein